MSDILTNLVFLGLFFQFFLDSSESFFYHFVKEELAEKVISYFKYYGKIAYDIGLWFILMVSAYDIGFLLKKAFIKKVKNNQRIYKTAFFCTVT